MAHWTPAKKMTADDSSLEISRLVARSDQNIKEVLASESCVCFHCRARFQKEEIKLWFDDDESRWAEDGNTACCPKCEYDAVVGLRAGEEIDDATLMAMNEHWYGRKGWPPEPSRLSGPSGSS